MDTWLETRKLWNLDGKCSREACKVSFVRRGRRSRGIHRDTKLEYCVTCTRLINEYNPMPDGLPLVVWTDEPVTPDGPPDLPKS